MRPSDARRARSHGGRSAKFRSVTLASALIAIFVAAPTAAASQSEDRHCVVYLIALSPKTEDGVITAALERGGCFGTLEEALEAGTGGQVALPQGISPIDLSQSVLDASVVAATDVLIGTEYENTSFAGVSHSFFAASGCAGTTWQVSNVGAALNDRFESGKGFGTCDHNRKFEHADFGGAVLLCTPNCSTYGTLRNEVTSLRWAD